MSKKRRGRGREGRRRTGRGEGRVTRGAKGGEEREGKMSYRYVLMEKTPKQHKGGIP